MTQGGSTTSTRCSQVDALCCDDLVANLTDELRVIARSMLASERPDHTLQPTALINELWLRMAPHTGPPSRQFPTRSAFLAYASRAIRNILVDHARRKRAAKRGGSDWNRSDGSAIGAAIGVLHSGSILDLEDEIKLLEKSQKQCARVFELRFFGGLTFQQIADWLDVPVRMVRDDWNFTRAWLGARLRQQPAGGGDGADGHDEHAAG